MSEYIRPSECQQCIPVESLTNDSGISWTIETSHEPTCPNNPRREVRQ
ncbi:hypothetical protein RI444_16570 [Paenarthrobacter sp. AT5]|nr:hypothetical protein [Paenarthrobacter sp. AT5]WOC60113.1 hypothetical protein RI444_16570 [Paenarthrobacter sp. AT5]